MRRSRPKKKRPSINKSVLAFGTPKKEAESKYSLYVRTQPCIVTHSIATEYLAIDPAHLRKYADGGAGSKPSDQYIFPLRHDLHKLQHNIGEVTFWQRVFRNEIEGVYMGEQLMFEALHALSSKMNEAWKNG